MSYPQSSTLNLDPQNTQSYNFKFSDKKHLDELNVYAREKFGKYHKADITMFEHGTHNNGYAGIIEITFIKDISADIKECIDYFYTYRIKFNSH